MNWEPPLGWLGTTHTLILIVLMWQTNHLYARIKRLENGK